MMQIHFKKLDDRAVIPTRAHDTDVGYDLTAIDAEYDVEHDMYIYHTGLAMESRNIFCDKVTATLGFPRSGNCKTEAYLTNSVGVIDSDGYRGEIQARYKNRTSLNTMIEMEVLRQVMKTLYDQQFISSLTPGSAFGRMKYEDIYDSIYNQTKHEYIERAKALEFAPYKPGDQCAQLAFTTMDVPFISEVESLSETERGEGGFGSTDAKRQQKLDKTHYIPDNV